MIPTAFMLTQISLNRLSSSPSAEVALVVPNQTAVRARLAEEGTPATDIAAWCARPEAAQWMQGRVERALANVSHHEQVRKVALLPRPFSVDRGEMTPSLKLRRGAIQQQYSDVIEKLYGGS